MTEQANVNTATKKYKSGSVEDKLNRHIKTLDSLDKSFTIVEGAITRIKRNGVQDQELGSVGEDAVCAVYERMIQCVQHLSAAFTFIVKNSDKCDTTWLEASYADKLKEFKALMTEAEKLAA